MDAFPATGTTVLLAGVASVQYRARPLRVRVTGVDAKCSVSGWCWIEGYVLDDQGDAVDRRRMFARLAGVQQLAPGRTAAAISTPDHGSVCAYTGSGLMDARRQATPKTLEAARLAGRPVGGRVNLAR